MKKNNSFQFIALLYFSFTTCLWLYLFLTKKTSGNLNFLFSFMFGLVPFFGGMIGMYKSKLWGGLHSSLGKAVFFISLGLFLWGFGENIWSYYNFFKDVPAPYPSVADIGFAPSIFFWVIGVGFLSHSSGAILAFKKSKTAKILFVSVPLFLLIPSYYIQIKLARGGGLIPEGETFLKSVLDVAYPFGDFIALTIATSVMALSYKYFGGFFKKSIVYILIGVGVMYFADSIFSYTTTKGTYYNANWGDLLLSLGVFLMSYGVLGFCKKPTSLKVVTRVSTVQENV